MPLQGAQRHDMFLPEPGLPELHPVDKKKLLKIDPINTINLMISDTYEAVCEFGIFKSNNLSQIRNHNY